MTPNWLDKKEYPFSAHYFEWNGHKLHFIDEGQGSEILLFVHGTPSWSFDYRHIIRRLSAKYRCIAIDHIGFGLSDKPERYDYSTQNHSHTLSAFIEQQQLRGITLIVHDFGGPIGLQMAIQNPFLIKRIVVLNSWLWSSEQDPDFIKFRKILKSPLLPFLYKYLNFSPRFILPQSFGDKKISKTLLKQYTKPFANKTQRNGALAFARSLLNDQSWFEELWQQRSVIGDKPILLIWGMKDKIVGPQNLDKFLSGFPNAAVLRLESSGHFPQEEQPEEIADRIEDFLRES